MTTLAPQAATCPTLPDAVEAFRETLVAKSPQTAINYVSALARFRDFLASTGLDSSAVRTDELPGDVLERFYAWLLRTYGRDHRSTAIAYAAEARAFFRFLDRRRWLHPDLSYERMKDDLRDLIGRVPCKTPRVDDVIAAVVTCVDGLPVPPATGANGHGRLEVLRDKAILKTLYATAVRR